MSDNIHIRGITKAAIVLSYLPVELTKSIIDSFDDIDRQDVVSEIIKLDHYNFSDETVNKIIATLFRSIYGDDITRFSSISEAVLNLEELSDKNPRILIDYILNLMSKF